MNRVPRARGQLLPDLHHVKRLTLDLAERLRSEPDLHDFLGWWGGTLEYWIHICTASVARRDAWAARSEVPYVTRAPAASAKTPIKWADGAYLWPDGHAVLLEVKTIPYRGQMGGAVTSIPTDLAALLAADWPATLAHQRGTDRYTDEDWWPARSSVQSLVGLQLAVVHGPEPMPNPDSDLAEGLTRGLGRALYATRKTQEPAWALPLRQALATPLLREEIGADGFSAVLYAWAGSVELISTH